MAGHRLWRTAAFATLLIFVCFAWLPRESQAQRWPRRPKVDTKCGYNSEGCQALDLHKTRRKQGLSGRALGGSIDHRISLPASKISRVILQRELQRLLPDQTKVTELLQEATPDPFFLDQKPIIAHRGIFGVIGNGYTSEMSMRALEAAAAAGATLIELDVVPLGPILPNQTFVLAHDKYTDRVVDQTGLWKDVEPASVEEVAMFHVVKLVNQCGNYTGESYRTEDRVATIKHVVESFMPRHPGINFIFDARDRDPVAVIVWLSHQSFLWRRIAVQVYFNNAFRSAAELSQRVSAAGVAEDWRDHIMIIPVVAASGIEKRQLPYDVYRSAPSVFHAMRQREVEHWIDSFDDERLIIPAYVLAVRAEDKFVDRKWHVDAQAVQSIVGRPLIASDERPLQNDKILHNLIARQRKRYNRKRRILVTSTTPTTMFQNTGMRMLFESREFYALQPSNSMEDWLVRSQAVVGSSRKHGGDGGTTDRWMHEVAALAHEVQGTTPPPEVKDAHFRPFSQEEYRRLALDSLNRPI